MLQVIAESFFLLMTTANLTVDVPMQSPEQLLGIYYRFPVENPWHKGEISFRGHEKTILEWKNQAGVSWDLFPDLEHNKLKTGSGNPYYQSGAKEFNLQFRDGELIGFLFGSDFFAAADYVGIPQLSGGLKGYLSIGLLEVPEGFGYGVSFYASVWSLINKPLAGFQIGLPSTWITPDNRDFKKPLCPPGTVARDNWPERGPYYQDVFQTIEGGIGYWVSTQFGSTQPKYRINGTPNGYNHEISSPGWGFGSVTPLKPEEIGIAQLSNSLLIPPDGITFGKETRGAMIGNAWMALPLTDSNKTSHGPTGEMCWTLFLNTSNFSGPVAFWIPEIWSYLSQSYPAINGRGLDNQPGRIASGAMEINTVPYFESTDDAGNIYRRIPQLRFPINQNGLTILMRDVRLYSRLSIYKRLKDWSAGKPFPHGRFDEHFDACWVPRIRSHPFSLVQGEGNTPLFSENILEPIVTEKDGSYAFALKWLSSETEGLFPEYYKLKDQVMEPVEIENVPQETNLVNQQFIEYNFKNSYQHVSVGNQSENGAKIAAGPFNIELVDGSIVTYSWYRFIDQPALNRFNWSSSKREKLQDLVENIHSEWSVRKEFMSAPQLGELVALDSSLVLTPPKGLEIGFVPIATRQSYQ